MNHNNPTARIQALSTADSYHLKPTSIVTYQSQGHVLIVGDQAALDLCNDFPEGLTITLLLSTRDNIIINGYLGNYQIAFNDTAGNQQQLNADMVVDLNSQPLLSCEVLPAGYLHFQLSAENIATLQNELLEMVGVFEKPKYFDYDPNICAHSSNGNIVCTQCIDACPADAISSIQDKIEVIPYLCQGGGSCATVCPSGAMKYVYPSLQDNGNRIRQMLQSYRQHGGTDPILLFHCEEELPDKLLRQHSNLLPLRIEELASAGAELWLSAIAYGASQVMLMNNDEVPNTSLIKLKQQIEWCHLILGGLGLDTRILALVEIDQTLPTVSSDKLFQFAEYAMADNKRLAFFQAIDHLYQQQDTTREVVSLSADAPFGTATIDENSCTLCMACVGSCPGKALQDGSNREMPEVFFIESHCIQCGTCTQICPEDAISISPRLILDREKRNQGRVLNQDTPFACISCGKPFAPTSAINKITLSLKEHYMFKTPRAVDRLKMCEDCRVADIVQDPDALKGNFDPLNSKSGKQLS